MSNDKRAVIFGIIMIVVLICAPAIFFHVFNAKNGYISTGRGIEMGIVVGKDIDSGTISIDYVKGDGYLDITHNGVTECYSNMGPERLLQDHMEFDLNDEDIIHISENLVLKIYNLKNMEVNKNE